MSTNSCTIEVYIESASSLKDRICRIEELIEQMELNLVTVTAGQGAVIDQYQMDDGQMTVRTSYRSVDDIEQGIHALEKLKQRYVNRFNGRSVSLRDARNINFKRGY
jgi:phage shock protein A